MKKSERIFEFLKSKIHSQNFIEEFKMWPKAFIRCRLLPFPIVFLFILNLLKTSIPKELNLFCKNSQVKKTSRSAVTQARSKISAQAYVKLNDHFIEEFYKENDYFTYQNFILLAVDGSTLQLPNSSEVVEKYGLMTNQIAEGMPGSRVSILYDVLNKVILHACLKPFASCEREMAIEHIEALKALNIDLSRFLVIFDRGYPSVALMHYLNSNQINFIIRSSGTGFIKEVSEVLNSGKKDQLVTITPKRLKRIHKSKLELERLRLEVNGDIVFRVVIVKLSTGEKEILLTSLLSKENYPHSIFLDIYFKRWCVEEGYKFIKAIEIENFSGKSILSIEQDFHATVLMANSHALLTLEAEEEINKQQKNSLCSDDKAPKTEKSIPQNGKKYAYCVNRVVSFAALKNEFVFMLLNPHSNVDEFCKKIKKIMSYDLVPRRPGRTFARVKKNSRKKYHMNQR